jgi:hypothetical protein
MSEKLITLPWDSAARKNVPVHTGCYCYFPAALAGVAKHSKAGNDKHNPGEEMHHARGKSSDHADCIARHQMDMADMLALLERGADTVMLPDGSIHALVDLILNEANANCWRALAQSQELHERLGGAPLAPRARVPRRGDDGAHNDGREWGHGIGCACSFNGSGPIPRGKDCPTRRRIPA